MLESVLRLPGTAANLVADHFQTRREMGEKLAGPLGGMLLGGGIAGSAIETGAQAVAGLNGKLVDTIM